MKEQRQNVAVAKVGLLRTLLTQEAVAYYQRDGKGWEAIMYPLTWFLLVAAMVSSEQTNR